MAEASERASREWMRPIARENLSDKVYGELRAALMHGRLEPGEQLPLRPLAESFGISATPMREAMTRLVVEGALTLDARGTVTVPRLTRTQLLEIRSIRMDLEGRCAEKAALCATGDQIAALEAIHEAIAQAQASTDFRRAVDLNTEFHLELCRIADLPITHAVVETLWVRCGPILTYLYDAGIPDGWDPHPHRRVIDAMKRRDAAGCREAIRFYIEKGGKGILARATD